ncbi:MAG: MarR family transcriptional regulator [Erysipelotrichaceae bacterium]|nr:MarR family transcriptional regulator [Erysipelotrichaceae bacterium]
MKNTDIHHYIKNINNNIQKLLYALYDQEDCSINNLWVVDYLYDQSDDIYQKDIEKEFSINRATASKMLALMEEKQLIQRIPSDKDGRLKKVVLLDKGLQAHTKAATLRIDIENTLSKNLTEEEVIQFKLMCKKIIQGLEEELNERQ